MASGDESNEAAGNRKRVKAAPVDPPEGATSADLRQPSPPDLRPQSCRKPRREPTKPMQANRRTGAFRERTAGDRGGKPDPLPTPRHCTDTTRSKRGLRNSPKHRGTTPLLPPPGTTRQGLRQGFAGEKFRPGYPQDSPDDSARQKVEVFYDDAISLVEEETEASAVRQHATFQTPVQRVQPYIGDEALVEAVVVDENLEYNTNAGAADDVIEARPTRWTDMLVNRYVLCLVAVLVLVFVAVVMVVVTFDNSGDKDTPGSAPEQSLSPNTLLPSPINPPTLTPTKGTLQDLLSPYTEEDAFSASPLALPQAQAYTWLSRHPELQDMSASRSLQLFGLASLYYATDGRNWDTKGNWQNHWLVYETHECEWGQYSNIAEPAPICDQDGMYHTLWLENSNLNGTVPPQISLLSSLLFLHCSDNFLISIPDEIWQLANLKVLDLHDNQIVGTLPTQVAQLKNLTDLQLYANSFNGPLPTEIGELSKLRLLSLTSNEISGTFPSELSLLSDLYILLLSTNQLVGSLPTVVGRLTNLERFRVSETKLASFLPTELGFLTRLTDLSLSSAQFEGQIPSELGLLTQLVELTLNSNALGGSIPLLSNLTKLKTLFLHDNVELFGSIPQELCGNPWGQNWWNGLWLDCLRVTCACGDDCQCWDEPDV